MANDSKINPLAQKTNMNPQIKFTLKFKKSSLKYVPVFNIF